jgi:hypothetical protein
MWVFFSRGFLSVVAHRTRDDVLLVRARRRKHLIEFVPEGTRIAHTPHADYPYRACVARDLFAQIVLAELTRVRYTNFKREAALVGGREGAPFTHALHDVWATLRAAEDAGARAVVASADADGARVSTEVGGREGEAGRVRLARKRAKG